MNQFDKTKYTCVIYPGVVENEERMITTLGGLENITMVCNKPNRRLELRLRPEDVYARPTCGDRKKSTGFLLKVKVKRKKKQKKSNAMEVTEQCSEIICEPVVMGRIEKTFTFTNLCDFQFLPMAENENGVTENIYKMLMPDAFPSVDWLLEPAPHFLPPAIFSRMDSVQPYMYRQEKVDASVCPSQANIIGRTRRRRSGYAVFVTFDVPAAPARPRPNSLKFLEVKFLAGEHYKKMKEMFEKRPIWSKMALLSETKYTVDQVKYLLPAVAYYFVTGPFRVMWVRMGYDPRKDPSSRIYQTLDYRLKGNLCKRVKAKRDCIDCPFPYKSGPAHKPRTLVMTQEMFQEQDEQQTIEQPHVFRRGVDPPSRQMFYQFCDIKVPEVEDMFARLPKLAPDAECDKQRGWLPPGFSDRVREIISSILIEEMEMEQNESQGTNSEVAGSGEGADDLEEQYEDDYDDGGDGDDNECGDNNDYYDNDYDDLVDDENDDDNNEDDTVKILQAL